MLHSGGCGVAGSSAARGAGAGAGSSAARGSGAKGAGAESSAARGSGAKGAGPGSSAARGSGAGGRAISAGLRLLRRCYAVWPVCIIKCMQHCDCARASSSKACHCNHGADLSAAALMPNLIRDPPSTHSLPHHRLCPALRAPAAAAIGNMLSHVKAPARREAGRVDAQRTPRRPDLAPHVVHRAGAGVGPLRVVDHAWPHPHGAQRLARQRGVLVCGDVHAESEAPRH